MQNYARAPTAVENQSFVRERHMHVAMGTPLFQYILFITLLKVQEKQQPCII